MALFKIFKGTKDRLGAAPSAGEQDTRYAHEGFAYFTRDDGKFYIDIEGSANNTDTLAVIGTNRIPLSAEKADKDSLGNLIVETYAVDIDFVNNNLTLIAGNGDSLATIPIMTAATASQAGEIGLVPSPQAGEQNKFLRGDATWQSVTWNNIENQPDAFPPESHSHGNINNTGEITATATIANGDKLAIVDNSNSSKITGSTITFDGSTTTKALTQKGTWETFNNYTLPTAADDTLGGIKTNYPASNASDKNYAIKVDNDGNAYVNVPWTDNNTWKANSSSSEGYVASGNGQANKVWKTDANGNPAWRDDANSGGTVTSVRVQASSPLQSSQSTAQNNTLNTTISFANQDANKVLAGPSSGSAAAAPTFRALVSADIPSSVSLSGVPTAPTADAGTNTTQIATTEFVTRAVSQGFVANDAMVFKGLIGSNQTITQLPTSGYNAGWTYRVADADTFAGEYCEVGDLLIAINDGPASGSSVIGTDWGKVEHNIDGALYKTNFVTYSGDKVLMSSGINGAVKEGTISNENVIKTITLSAGSVPTLGDAFSIPNVTENTSVTASKVTKSDNTVVKTISQASSTSSVIGTVANGVLTLTEAITAVGAVTAGSTATASAVTITDVTATYTSLGTMFTVPNVINVGTLPSLTTTTQSVITGIS